MTDQLTPEQIEEKLKNAIVDGIRRVGEKRLRSIGCCKLPHLDCEDLHGDHDHNEIKPIPDPQLT